MPTRSFLAALLCAAMVAACSASAADPAGASCDQFGSTPSIEQARTIEAGTELRVALCSNPTTGFAWGEPAIGDPAVIRLVDRTFLAPGEASPPVVGAAGTEILTIESVAPGTTTVSISYGRTWVDGTQGAWTYALTVTVR